MSAETMGAWRSSEAVPVLVIGAGQAGLAAAYWLKQEGLASIVVEAAERIGDPPRFCRRPVVLSFAAIAGSASEA